MKFCLLHNILFSFSLIRLNYEDTFNASDLYFFVRHPYYISSSSIIYLLLWRIIIQGHSKLYVFYRGDKPRATTGCSQAPGYRGKSRLYTILHGERTRPFIFRCTPSANNSWFPGVGARVRPFPRAWIFPRIRFEIVCARAVDALRGHARITSSITANHRVFPSLSHPSSSLSLFGIKNRANV